MGDLIGLIGVVKSFSAGSAAVLAAIAVLIVLLLRSREVDISSVTSIGKLQIEQMAALMTQNTKLASDLDALRQKMAETYNVIEDLHKQIGDLEDLVRDYKRKCDDCPGPGGKAFGLSTLIEVQDAETN